MVDWGRLESWKGNYGYVVPNNQQAVGHKKIFIHLDNRKELRGEEFLTPERHPSKIWKLPKRGDQIALGRIVGFSSGRSAPKAVEWAAKADKLREEVPFDFVFDS